MKKPMKAPMPNAKAMERANENARFKRPETGGPMQPTRPGMPAMARSMPGSGRGLPTVTRPGVPAGAPMPLRRAKGGMTKGKKK